MNHKLCCAALLALRTKPPLPMLHTHSIVPYVLARGRGDSEAEAAASYSALGKLILAVAHRFLPPGMEPNRGKSQGPFVSAGREPERMVTDWLSIMRSYFTASTLPRSIL
jgi:hypothetical protein